MAAGSAAVFWPAYEFSIQAWLVSSGPRCCFNYWSLRSPSIKSSVTHSGEERICPGAGGIHAKKTRPRRWSLCRGRRSLQRWKERLLRAIIGKRLTFEAFLFVRCFDNTGSRNVQISGLSSDLLLVCLENENSSLNNSKVCNNWSESGLANQGSFRAKRWPGIGWNVKPLGVSGTRKQGVRKRRLTTRKRRRVLLLYSLTKVNTLVGWKYKQIEKPTNETQIKTRGFYFPKFLNFFKSRSWIALNWSECDWTNQCFSEVKEVELKPWNPNLLPLSVAAFLLQSFAKDKWYF